MRLWSLVSPVAAAALAVSACASEEGVSNLPSPASSDGTLGKAAIDVGEVRPQLPVPASADVTDVTDMTRPVGVRFVDVTAETGLDFVHATGSAGSYPMPAIMGGGVAVFDADGDGLLDIYFPNAGSAVAGDAGRNRLYLQGPRGRFVDATEGSGLDNPGHGMGAAVGDIDNDGDLDLYVTNHGADVLYRNQGSGRFVDATAELGLATSAWSTSAVFFDADLDGWLDLYVARYVQWREARECRVQGGRVDYCGPQQFEGEADVLYRNEGGRRFVDRSREAGVSLIADAGLGVAAADFDDDGRVDVYVANDADPNQLWMNRGDGMFEDDAVLQGAAYNRFGVGEAGMGIAVGDIDGDLDLDLFLSHLIEETNTLYVNLGGAAGLSDGSGEEVGAFNGFDDRAAEAGLAAPSTPYTGFGTAFFDADNDGDLDLAVVNGAVKRRPTALSDRSDWFWRGYAEPNLLMLGDGAGAFVDASAASGDFGAALDVSRGLVPFDLEGDGDLDLLVSNLEGPARIYRNELAGGSRGRVSLRVVDPELRRTAFGASVVAWIADRPVRRRVLPLGGYLTGGETPIHIGLGAGLAEGSGGAWGIERFEVTWPDGAVEEFDGARSGAEIVLARGEGR